MEPAVGLEPTTT